MHKTLKQKAIYTAGAAIALTLIKSASNFILTPLIISSLGHSLYGTWATIQQIINTISLSDLKPVSTLKYTLATTQHLEDSGNKNKQIGAAIILWLITLPLFLFASFICIYNFDSILQIQSKDYNQVRFSLFLCLLALFLDRIVSLPSSILRAQNFDYLGTSLKFTWILGFATLSWWLFKNGHGLITLASLFILNTLANGLINFYLMRKAVSWVNPTLPSKNELSAFSKTSLWIFLAGMGMLLISGAELILLNHLSDATMAARYAATTLLLKFLYQVCALLISGANPGMANLCGAKLWNSVNQARLALHVIALSIGVSMFATLSMLNHQIIELWLEKDLFLGNGETIILCLTSVVCLSWRVELSILDGLNLFKVRALISVLSGCLGIILASTLFHYFNTIGFCFGFLIANMLFLALIAITNSQVCAIRPEYLPFQGLKLAMSILAAVTLSTCLYQQFTPTTWIEILFFSFISISNILGFIFLFGLNKKLKSYIFNSMIITKFKKLSFSAS